MRVFLLCNSKVITKLRREMKGFCSKSSWNIYMSLYDVTSLEHSLLSAELRTAPTVYRDSGLDAVFLASQLTANCEF